MADWNGFKKNGTPYIPNDATARAGVIANTKLIKDTVGWSGKQKLHITLSKLKELNTGGTWVDNVYTFKGLTFTVEHDGDEVLSITQTGTSNGSGYLFMGVIPLKNGDSFILSGSASNSSGSTTYMRVGKGGTEGSFVLSSIGGAETPVNISEDNNYSFNIACGSAGITGTYVWKPMLRDANILDNTYEPYHESVEDYAFPRSEQAVLGAKNLLENLATSGEVNGITFTVNTDGTISANGTATSTVYKTITPLRAEKLNGNFIISGCPKVNGVTLQYNDSTAQQSVNEQGDGANITCISGHSTQILIIVNNGTILNNVVFKPMISLDGGDYAPYAMTNRELTEILSISPVADGTIIKEITSNNCYIIPSHKLAVINMTLKVGTYTAWAGAVTGLPKLNAGAGVAVVFMNQSAGKIFGGIITSGGNLQLVADGASAPAEDNLVVINVVYKYESL